MGSSSKGNQGFISGALTGGSGKSNGIETQSIGKGQRVMRAYPMDNVNLAMEVKTSMRGDRGFGGGDTDLSHSLSGASAVQDPK